MPILLKASTSAPARRTLAATASSRAARTVWALGLLFLLALNACTPTAAPEIRSLADVEHARIGVMTGSTGEGIAAARFPEGDIKSFDDIMDAVAALKSGQLDCVITGYPSALQVTKKNTELHLYSRIGSLI